MHRLFLALCLLLCFIGHVPLTMAQGGDSDPVVSTMQGYAPPSPTAASLGQFGDVPVGMYTGAPSIDIPLYVISGKRLSVPITLRYQTSGLKAEGVPGWVGAGWSLDAGGVVTRTVIGRPDEEPEVGYLQGMGQTPNAVRLREAWASSPYQAGGGVHSAWRDIVRDAEKGHDFQPDAFYYSFEGRSGQFTVAPGASGNDHAIVAMPAAPISIDTVGTGWGNGWRIIDEHGTTRLFTIEESSSLYVSSQAPVNYSYASAWYLASIEDLGGEIAEFEYDTSWGAKQRQAVPSVQGLYIDNSWDQHGFKPCGSENSWTESTYSSTEIDLITLSKITLDDYDVRFYVSRDEAWHSQYADTYDFHLDSIEVRFNDNLLRSFHFEYIMYMGRLQLVSLSEVGYDNQSTMAGERYTFEYYNDHQGDTFGRLTNQIDHWGFYNGENYSWETGGPARLPKVEINGIPYGSADRRPAASLQIAQAGALARVIYPTGGYTAIEYEQHDYGSFFNPSGTYEMVEHMMEYQAGVSQEPTTDPFDDNAPILVELQHDAQAVLRARVECTGCAAGGAATVTAEIRKNGESEPLATATAYFNPAGTSETTVPFSFTLQPNVEYTLWIEGDHDSMEPYLLSGSIDVDYWRPHDPAIDDPAHYGETTGGIRVRRVSACDAMRDCAAEGYSSVKEYLYRRPEAEGPGGTAYRSTGVLLTLPVYTISSEFSYYRTCGGGVGDCCVFETKVDCTWGYSAPVSALGMSQGSHVVYTEVIVVRQGAGSTRHVFRGPVGVPASPDTVIDPPPLSGEVASSGLHWRTTLDWMRGQNLVTEHRDEEGTPIQIESAEHAPLAYEFFPSGGMAPSFSSQVGVSNTEVNAFWAPAFGVRTVLSVEQCPCVDNSCHRNARVLSRYKNLSGWFPLVEQRVEMIGE